VKASKVRETDDRRLESTVLVGNSIARFAGSNLWLTPHPALKRWAIFISSALRTRKPEPS